MKKKLQLSEESIKNLNTPIVEELSEIKPIISHKYECRHGILEIYNQGFDRDIFCISFQDYRAKSKSGEAEVFCLFRRGVSGSKWLSSEEMINLPIRSRKKMLSFSSFEDARMFMLENCSYETDPKW